MSQWRNRIRELAPADRARYEGLAEQFESAWTEAAVIESFLAEGRVRMPLLVHLVKCDMEFRDARGESRMVEDYCELFPELATDAEALLEVVLCEYQLHRPNWPSREEFVRRFPKIKELKAAITDLEPTGEWTPPDEYEILEELGQGNWGVVYKARHTRLDRIQALKVVKSGTFRDRELRARVQRLLKEIPVAARLNHPNIVHLDADGESNGVPYFAMEYCSGGSLERRLSKGPLTPRDAAQLLKTLAIAAHHVHVFGLIHRDLKPPNILFGAGDVPKIADFGLALVREDASVRNEIAGTPAYMAPEQVDPKLGPTDEKTDVYGLGAVLYECLVGRPPFLADDKKALFHRILNDTPASLRDADRKIHADLDAICRKCLAKAPKSRYSDAQELADDLNLFLAGAPVQAKSHLPFRLMGHWVKTNPAKTAVAVFLVVLAIVSWVFQTHVWEQEIQQAKGLAASEKRREHIARVAAARQSARRGDWNNAMAEFDRAISTAEPEADALHLRVERLVGFFALNQTERLTTELDILEHMPLGDAGPQVKLLRAAWLLCDFARQGEDRLLARDALKNRQRLFTDADRKFAEGLAADRVGIAVKAFAEAFETDPLHYLAASSYTIALAAVGERDEVLRHAKFLRSFFPYSPMPDLAEAIVAFSDGNRDVLKAKLKAVSVKLTPDQQTSVERMQSLLLTLTDLQDLALRCAGGEDLAAGDYLMAAQLILQAKREGGLPNLNPLGLPVPAVGLYQTRLLEIVTAYLEVGMQIKTGLDSQSTFRRLQALNDDYRDAAVTLMMAIVRLRLTVAPLNRAELGTVRANLKEVSDLCAAAVTAPSLAYRSPIPYMGRGLGMIADIAQMKLEPRPDPVHLQRVRGNIHLVVEEGQRWPKLRPGVISLTIHMATAPLTLGQAANSKIDTLEGREAYRKRCNQIASLCRAILDDWSNDEPSSSAIEGFRARLTEFERSSGIVVEKN